MDEEEKIPDGFAEGISDEAAAAAAKAAAIAWELAAAAAEEEAEAEAEAAKVSQRLSAARAAEAPRAAPQAEFESMPDRTSVLEDIELEATLQFGSRELTLREVLDLGPGDVVELDRHISEPVDLVVGDRIVARGEVVVASGNFALRITEVATPQLRLESIRCLF